MYTLSLCTTHRVTPLGRICHAYKHIHLPEQEPFHAKVVVVVMPLAVDVVVVVVVVVVAIVVVVVVELTL